MMVAEGTAERVCMDCGLDVANQSYEASLDPLSSEAIITNERVANESKQKLDFTKILTTHRVAAKPPPIQIQ